MATSRALALPAISRTDGGLSHYISQVQKFPMLSADQEFMLGKRFQETGDRQAVHELITSHLRLVVKVAFGYRGYGLPLGDLIAEGNLGLMQAVKKFDPDRGFRLSTYALWWIRASIQEFVLKSWSLVKIGTTAAQKKLFFGLRKAKAAMHAMEADLTPAQVHEIADRLNVTEREVVEMNGRMAGGDASLNTPMTLDGEAEWIETLVDSHSSVEQDMSQTGEYDDRMGMLRAAMGKLNPREREIFTERRLTEEPKTLEELAARHNISRERVRQIEAKAYEKVQLAMTKVA
jgi:RNA polymerase sigma-32 factor